jgi:hypothetical protein
MKEIYLRGPDHGRDEAHTNTKLLTLPSTLQIAEVNIDFDRQRKSSMIRNSPSRNGQRKSQVCHEA